MKVFILKYAKLLKVLMGLTLLLSFIVSAAHAALVTTPGQEPDFAAVDAYVVAQMKDIRIPGLALGIVHGDQVVTVKGYGIADPSGRAVTPQTPFILGSTTKSITALAVMQLVEAGKVDLDAPVQRYLPWFRVADEQASSQITVRHLLNQTSGLSEASGLKDETSRDMSDSALESRVRALSHASLNRPVGAAFEYSNANYDVLGLIVQTVAGQAYEAYVQQHIFSPLGMRHSFTSQADAMQQGMASGHRFWFGRPAAFVAPYPRASLPHGYLISSAEDMAHYLITYLNGGQYEGRSILSPAGIAAMHEPAARVGEREVFYGMGWFVGEMDGLQIAMHGGDLSNFHANMILFPEQKWGVVVLENAENYMAADRMDALALGVANLLVGRQPAPAEANGFLRIVFAVIVVGVLLQVIGMIWSAATLRRWQREPERRPRGWRRILWHVGGPFVLYLGLGLIWLVGVPGFFGRSLAIIILYIPDMGYTLLVGGVLAIGWAFLRTGLVYFMLRSVRVTRIAGEPAKA